MKNTIIIYDNASYVRDLNICFSDLKIDKTVSSREYNSNELLDYNMVVFLLSPFEISSKRFLDGIQCILNIRKNSQSIIFALNESERLSPKDIHRVKFDLEEALYELIKEPKILFISTSEYRLYEDFKVKALKLLDIQKNNKYILKDEKGFPISGKMITEECIVKLKYSCNIPSLINQINNIQESINKYDIDISKKNIVVLGKENIGKTSFINLATGDNESYNFKEVNEISSKEAELIDKVIIILDLDIRDIEEKIEEIVDAFHNKEKIFIINRIDEYMYFDKRQACLIEEIKNIIRRYTDESIYCFSSYYIKKYIQHIKEEIQIQEIIDDENIVLEDKLGLPLIKELNKENIIELLKVQSGISELNKCLEEMEC